MSFRIASTKAVAAIVVLGGVLAWVVLRSPHRMREKPVEVVPAQAKTGAEIVAAAPVASVPVRRRPLRAQILATIAASKGVWLTVPPECSVGAHDDSMLDSYWPVFGTGRPVVIEVKGLPEQGADMIGLVDARDPRAVSELVQSLHGRRRGVFVFQGVKDGMYTARLLSSSGEVRSDDSECFVVGMKGLGSAHLIHVARGLPFDLTVAALARKHNLKIISVSKEQRLFDAKVPDEFLGALLSDTRASEVEADEGPVFRATVVP